MSETDAAILAFMPRSGTNRVVRWLFLGADPWVRRDSADQGITRLIPGIKWSGSSSRWRLALKMAFQCPLLT